VDLHRLVWLNGAFLAVAELRRLLLGVPGEDLRPLVLLASVHAGRMVAFDRRLARRCDHRWPF